MTVPLQTWQRLSSAGAFMVPGLALWLPSGYSWGALLLLLCTLASAPQWLGRAVPRSAWWLTGSVLAMLAIGLLDVGIPWELARFDKPGKYLLALPCIFYLLAFPPDPDWLWRGVFAGACGSGLLALYQTAVLELPRATGFTNAIQYGNLSLLLGLGCAAVLTTHWGRWSAGQRLAWAVALLLGCLGSVLSESRGGWLALVLVLPVGGWLLRRRARRSLLLRGALALALALAALLAFKGQDLRQRLDTGYSEAVSYQHTGDASTSVGHRLEHWRMAWSMVQQRPWLGWGRSGYEQEKARRVATGQVQPSVLQYHHAHNELLDLGVKHGLPGVLVLCLFYGVPLALFWPHPRRVLDAAGRLDRTALALCLVGILLPLSYFAFGWTQVFLAHNSGNMFYLFMCPLVHAALQACRQQARAAMPMPAATATAAAMPAPSCSPLNSPQPR